MRHSLVLILILFAASCTDRHQPDVATAIAGPTPVLLTPSLPTNVPGVLALSLPFDAADASLTVFGVTPYGYHGGDHSAEGHAGWDFAFGINGVVRAAAAGVVEFVLPDPAAPGRFVIRVEHLVGNHYYRTVYSNIVTPAADIAENEVVRAGQAIGAPGTITQQIGSSVIVYRMTHFQLDDLESYREGLEPNAVTPESFLTPAARSLFDQMFLRVAYPEELVEPFATNPRQLSFPTSRTWLRAGGDGPAGIRFTRRSRDNSNYEYALLAESGTVIEAGTVTIGLSTGSLPTIDLVSPVGRRVGIYDVRSNEMRLWLATAGSPRPNELDAASVYRTAR